MRRAISRVKRVRNSETLSHARFSKANLTVFAIIFCAIGGYFIYSSFAATASCTKTLNAGGSIASFTNSLVAGDVGCVHSGTYNIGNYTFPNSGTSTNPITLTSYPGEKATINGSVMYIPAGKNFITLDNLNLTLTTANGAPSFQLFGDDITLSNNDITNNHQSQSCISLGEYEQGSQYARQVARPKILGNKIHDCGKLANGAHDHGLYMAASSGAVITDNLFWGNQGGWGIQLWTSASNSTITHNVIDGNYSGNIVIGAGDPSDFPPSSNNTFSQNIITNPASGFNVQWEWGGATGTGNNFTNNCMFGGTNFGGTSAGSGNTTSGNTTADPQYVNRTAHDFSLQPGSPCLSVVGYDTAAKLAGSGGGSDTTPPTVSLTAPTAGATVSGSSVTVSANASDNVGVVGVQFKLDGANLSTEDTSSPYSVIWNTTTATNGTHTLTAVARDAAGNTTTSSSVSVTVSNTVPDSTPPTVSFTAPTSGATVSGSSVTVSANASDNVGVSGVQFKLDGSNLSTEDTSSPYSITWNSTTTSNGSHTLTAVARDAAGNTTTSSSVTVTVSNTATPKTGDINGDNSVNITDLSLLLSSYNQNTTQCTTNNTYKCDLSSPGDGVVNIFDLSILLSHYGS